MTGPLAYQREEQRVPMDGESGGWSFTLNTTHLVSQATHSFSWQKVPGEKSNFFFYILTQSGRPVLEEDRIEMMRGV